MMMMFRPIVLVLDKRYWRLFQRGTRLSWLLTAVWGASCRASVIREALNGIYQGDGQHF